MWKDTLRVGFLLGARQVRHASIWTTGLIVFVMMLTFLNLVVVSGILVGIIEGSVKAYSDQYTGDIFLSTKVGKDTIEQSRGVIATIETIPGVRHYTARYTQGVQLEANYRERRDPRELRDTVNTTLVGLNPEVEDVVTGLSDKVIEGDYLSSDDTGYVLLGSMNLEQYSPLGQGDEYGFPTLSNVGVGSRIRMTSGGATKEYIVKGIVDTKVDQVSMRVFFAGERVYSACRANKPER